VIQVAAAIFVVATLGSAWAPAAVELLISRVVLGFVVRCVAAVLPVYICEISPAERRGRLVNQNEVMIVTGQLIAFVMNAALILVISGNTAWRWMLGIAVIPALLLLGMSLVPETPPGHAQRRPLEDAVRVLQRIRPHRAEADEAASGRSRTDPTNMKAAAAGPTCAPAGSACSSASASASRSTTMLPGAIPSSTTRPRSWRAPASPRARP
jgi:MFS family permease